MSNYKIVLEEPTAQGLAHLWTLQETIFEAKTPYQEMLIARGSQGIGLFCNQERQSTELSQKIYHEGQWFPAALLTEALNRVLIIGSSEGVVTQMARESGAKEIVHVDIDELCVRACSKHLPYGYTENDVEKYLQGGDGVKLVFTDGHAFVEEALARGERFDVIVMDLPDEQVESSEAQQNRLYGECFLGKISGLLSEKGVFITQAGCPTYWRNQSLRQCWERMSKTFRGCVYFEMEEQNWSWIIGGNFENQGAPERMQSRLEKLPVAPTYIDETSIRRATILPISIRKKL